MKKWCYIDCGGIMHITQKLETAVEYAKKGSRVIPLTDTESHNGYPVVDGKEIIVYGRDDMRYEARGEKIEPIERLAALYEKCGNK